MKHYAAIPKQLWEHPRFIALSAISKAALIYGIAVQGRQKHIPVTLDRIARYFDFTSVTLFSIADELEQQQFMTSLPDWGTVIDVNLEGANV